KNLDRCEHPSEFYRIDTGLTYPFIITSLQFARSAKNRKYLTSIYWDYVIFDEAHHLRRYMSSGTGNYRETLAYTLGKELSKKTNSLLLLTATPIQLHSFDLFSLLQLIRPDLFLSFEDFEFERKRLPLINMLIVDLHRFYDLNQFQRRNMVNLIESVLTTPPLINKAVHQFYEGISFEETMRDKSDKELKEDNDSKLEGKSDDKSDDKLDRQFNRHAKDLISETIIEPNRIKLYNYSAIEKAIQTLKGRELIIKKLQKYHFLSHFMVRNRKRHVYKDKFNERIVENVQVQLTKDEETLYKSIRLYLAKTYNEAMSSKNNALGFVMVILQKLATSSPPALISSLEKRIKKIKQYIEEKGWDLKPESVLQEMNLEEDDWDDWIELGSYAIDRIEQADKIKKEIEQNIKQLQVLKDFLKQLKQLHEDSKLDKLKEIVTDINTPHPQKVIIFTQFVKTLHYLEEELSKLNLDISVFHGSLTKEDKGKAVEYFKNYGDVLISTEAGGEGRNFQFCNIIINYDLPWNPMKLEQRIGRIDRIGQKKDIYIYNFTTLGTIESRIFEMLTKRIKLFKESVGNLEPILRNIGKSINKAILSDDNIVKTIEEFSDSLESNTEKAEEIGNQLDDFVLDKKSFQHYKVDQILDNRPYTLKDQDIFTFFNAFFNKLKIDGNSLGKIDRKTTRQTKKENMRSIEQTGKRADEDIFIIRLDDKLRRYTNLGQTEYEGVFNLELAKKEENLDFFALGHPLVNELSELCRDETFGNSSSILHLNSVHLGKLLDKDSISIGTENYHKEMKFNKRERHLLSEFLKGNGIMWMLVFESEFNGIFTEKNIRPVIVSEDGYILETLSEYLKYPRNMIQAVANIKNGQYNAKIGNPKEKTNEFYEQISKIQKKQLKSIIKRGQIFYKKRLQIERPKLEKYNEIMFKNELRRKLSLYQFKKAYITDKIEIYEDRINYLETKRPSKRQWLLVERTTDKQRKKRLTDRYNRIIKEIRSLHLETDELKKQLDELEFDLPEDIKRLEFYRKLSKRVWLSQIALILID
ncbi:MAG: hypothetical protein GF364_17480, partial [Candidatus Lokiarchaeota archaeon]|nr:hypothetical protein [Candidatus Lokiarchaeota archaeon]